MEQTPDQAAHCRRARWRSDEGSGPFMSAKSERHQSNAPSLTKSPPRGGASAMRRVRSLQSLGRFPKATFRLTCGERRVRALLGYRKMSCASTGRSAAIQPLSRSTLSQPLARNRQAKRIDQPNRRAGGRPGDARRRSAP